MKTKYNVSYFNQNDNDSYSSLSIAGESISCRKHNVAVVEFRPDKPIKTRDQLALRIKPLSDMAKKIMVIEEVIGFSAITPLRSNVKQVIDQDSLVETNGSGIFYFELNKINIDDEFKRRIELVSHEEWIIGGCLQELKLPKEQKWWGKDTYINSQYLIEQMKSINCMTVFHGETGEFIVFVKYSDEVDMMATDLFNSL